jgi:nucleoside-diphosphate-sugar epimerase
MNFEQGTDDGFLEDKRVLITGGLGFIGSHLVKRLLGHGAKISVLDLNQNQWRVKDEIKYIDVYNIDITDSLRVDRCIRDIRPQYVFHLAAYGVDSAQKLYLQAANVNILGTINLLNSLKETGCEKIICTSTCSEYGNRDGKLCEDMCPDPVNIYGSTKACSTIIAHQIARENNINIVTLRLFGIFGEGEERHKFFCDLILSLLEGKDVKLTLCEQCRDYCYVENIVDGLIMAVRNNSIKNDIFNIGSGISRPLKYYVDMIFKYVETDRKPDYGALEYRKNEMWNPQPDITKIKSVLSWVPRIALEEGIKRTVEWFKQNKAYYL